MPDRKYNESASVNAGTPVDTFLYEEEMVHESQQMRDEQLLNEESSLRTGRPLQERRPTRRQRPSRSESPLDDELPFREGQVALEEESVHVEEPIEEDEYIPDGPQLRKRTPEQQRERIHKKKRRKEKRQKVKQAALDKTPKKLKNPTDIQVRFRTGFVYIALTVISLLLGDITTVLMVMAVAGICAGEFYYMLRSDAKLPNEALGIIAAVLYPPCVYFYGLLGAVGVTIGLLLALIIWYVFWMRARVPDVGVSLFGATYTGLLLSGIVVIRQGIPGWQGTIVLLLLFMAVWASDVFAYLAGRKYGKHKLAPRTSPKKSWEGLFAGLGGMVFFWILISFVPDVSMSIFQAVIFGIITGLMSVLGDLAESRIKRNSGFKDSGTIMPGHGGLLDRCDSLFLSAITAAILMVGGGCLPNVII